MKYYILYSIAANLIGIGATTQRLLSLKYPYNQERTRNGDLGFIISNGLTIAVAAFLYWRG